MTVKAKCPNLSSAAKIAQRRQRPSPSVIEYHWNLIPAQVRLFIIDDGHLNSKDGPISFKNLVNFWSSSPENISNAQRAHIRDSCWYLAQAYCRASAIKEARALTINGAFIHQCTITSIDFLRELCDSDANQQDIMSKLSCLAEGFSATESPEKMGSYIQRHLPQEVQDAMTELASLSSNRARDSTTAVSKMKLRFLPKAVNTGIADELHEFAILTTTPLNVVFAEYARQQGICLRLIRFTFNSNILFMSQLKRKTPKDFGMQDMDVIIVEDISRKQPHKSQEKSTDTVSGMGMATTKQAKKNSSSSQKPRRKKKKREHDTASNSQDQRSVKTEAELQVEHSKKLTKIHEEAAPHLQRIRQRLNSLLLERSQPKIRCKLLPNKSIIAPRPLFIDKVCQGGKAGIPCFNINVGEASNLYKTSVHKNASSNAITLDLHGLTKEIALETLDMNLPHWVNLAMRSSYPFIQKVCIICGCGNQILSECVKNWIRQNKLYVANAPKSCHM